MRDNPARKRVFALTLFLAGAAAMTVALMTPDGGTGRGFTPTAVQQAVLLVGGFMACGWASSTP